MCGASEAKIHGSGSAMPADQPTEDAVLLQLTRAAGVDLAPVVYNKVRATAEGVKLHGATTL